jgi:hypothetical protein
MVVIALSRHAQWVCWKRNKSPGAKEHAYANSQRIFPSGENCRGINDTISPVNSFRIVFSDYFDTGLTLLPDRDNWAPVYEHSLELIEVSSDLTF